LHRGKGRNPTTEEDEKDAKGMAVSRMRAGTGSYKRKISRKTHPESRKNRELQSLKKKGRIERVEKGGGAEDSRKPHHAEKLRNSDQLRKLAGRPNGSN